MQLNEIDTMNFVKLKMLKIPKKKTWYSYK